MTLKNYRLPTTTMCKLTRRNFLQHSQKFLETWEWPRWRLWWPSFGSGIGASEREGHWRLASLCFFCKNNSPSAFTPFVKAKVFWPLSVLFCNNMCSSWKGSEGIESTRQICSVSTSEIKAENKQFDHENIIWFSFCLNIIKLGNYYPPTDCQMHIAQNSN